MVDTIFTADCEKIAYPKKIIFLSASNLFGVRHSCIVN